MLLEKRLRPHITHSQFWLSRASARIRKGDIVKIAADVYTFGWGRAGLLAKKGMKCRVLTIYTTKRFGLRLYLRAVDVDRYGYFPFPVCRRDVKRAA